MISKHSSNSKSVWTEIIRIAIAVLSAMATAFGVQSCC